MRRKDREVTSSEETEKIIKKCDTIKIALNGDGFPYIVPLNFGYTFKDGFTFYFHSAQEGRKTDLIKKDNRAAFLLDCSHKLIKGKTPCGFTMNYESVMGEGKIEIVPENQKSAALNIIVNHYVEGEFAFPPEILNKTAVFKLNVTKISCKRNMTNS